MKITAIPFLLGSLGYAYFVSGDYTFTSCTGVLLSILVLTKQVKPW